VSDGVTTALQVHGGSANCGAYYRGILEDGAIADLTVFDPQTIRGNATIANPNLFSSGIDLVIVRGKIAFRDGRSLAKNGGAIKA
jgi:N-acyl-D-aspartate/D-glutamate deacylase